MHGFTCTEKPDTVSPNTVPPDTITPAQRSKEGSSKKQLSTDEKGKTVSQPSRHWYGMYQNVRTKNCKNSRLSFQQTIRAALNDCRNIWLPAEGAIKIIWLPSAVGQDEIPNSPNCPHIAMITTGTRREKVYEYNVRLSGSYSGSERT